MSRRERSWDEAVLSAAAAKQADIAVGDVVRAYDFPGSRDDVYVEGVVIEVDRDLNRVTLHVTREVWEGVEEQVTRFEVSSPLGVSTFLHAPCVFLIAKGKCKQVAHVVTRHRIACVLHEVSQEITRVNQAIGHTVFNPS